MSEAVFLDTFLTEKIVSRSVEIRDRAVDALARKIEIGAVSVETISHKYIKVVGALLQWINERQKEADFNRFIDVLDILKRVARVEAGNALLRRYQCVEFMQNFSKNCTQALGGHIEELIKIIVQKGNIEATPPFQENQENRNTANKKSLEMSMDGTFDRAIFPFSETMHETVKPPHQEFKSPQAPFTFSNTLSFKQSIKKTQPHPIMHSSTLPSGGSISQKGVVNMPSTTPDSLDGCEMPVVHLCQADAQALFDLSVNIKFGDISNIYRSSCTFEHQMLQDYPVEVFLQKGDVIKVSLKAHSQSMLDALDGARGIFVNPIGFTPLLAFLNKLVSIHKNHSTPLSRPQTLSSTPITSATSYTSTLSKKIRQEQTALSPLKNDFLLYSYPCSDLDLWKDAGSSRAKSSESISSFDAVKLIALRCIQNLIDRKKIGIYSVLISSSLHVAQSLAHSKEKMSSFLSQALDRFSDILRHYGDEIFASAILRQILTLTLQVTDLALSEDISLKNLMTQDGAIASTLERAIYHSIIFYPYVEKACTVLQEVNADAVRRYLHCKSIGDALKDTQEYQRRVLASLPGGQLRIKSSQQFEEAADFFTKFIDSLEMQSDDFSVESKSVCNGIDVIPDLLNYSAIMEAASLDGRYTEMQSLFGALMASQHAEMKMRVIQRLKFKIRTTLEMRQSGVSVPAGGYQQLASFLSQGQVLRALLDESLLTDAAVLTEIGDLIVLIYHSLSPSERSDPTRFIAQMPLFQCLALKNGQFKGLVSLSESVNDFCWLLRALRDLWSVKREQRMLASNTLINKIRDDLVSHYHEERDFLFQAFGPVEKIAFETHHSLLGDSQNLDFKGFDADNLLKMARSSYTEPALKKTSMEQLTLLLSEQSVQFKEVLVEQKNSVFEMCTQTLHSAFSSIMGVEALDPHFLDYMSQIMRFLWRSFFRFPAQVSHWFSQFEAHKQSEESMRVLESLQAALLKEHMPIRQNALKLLQVILFHSKHGKVSDHSGQAFFLVPQIEKEAYHFIFKTKLKGPQEEDPVIVSQRYSRLNPLFKIYLSSQETSLPSEETKDERKRIQQDFLSQCRARSCLGQLRESWDFLANYLLYSWQHFDMEQILVGLLEVLKILPTSEQEGQFASDIIENMSSVFNFERHDYSALIGDNRPALVHFYKNFGSVLTRHVLPFLFEVGISSLSALYHLDYLHNIFQLTLTLLEGQSKLEKSNDSLLRMLAQEQKFIDYLHQLFVYFKNNTLLRGDILKLTSLVLKSPYSVELELRSFTCTIINFLAAAQSTKQSLVDTGLIKKGLLFLKQMHKRSIALSLQNREEDLNSDSLQGLTREVVKQFNSYGWLIRYVDSRDAKIRTMAWSILTDMCGTDMLKQHPSLISQAVECVLKDGELYAVKTQTLSFLIKVASSLEESEVCNEEGVPSQIREFLEVVHRSACISKLKTLLVSEGTPALFLEALLNFVSKLIDLDYENTLTVLTQLDIWTLLANMADYKKMSENEEMNETREGAIQKLLPEAQLDTLHSCIASLGFLIQTAVLRQPEIATYLSSSTCIVYELLKLGTQKYAPYLREERNIEEGTTEVMLKPAITSIAGAIQAIIVNSREVGEIRICEALMQNPESLDFILSIALQEQDPEKKEANQLYDLKIAVAKMGASLIKLFKNKADLESIFDNDTIEDKDPEELLCSRGAFLLEVANEAFALTFERAQNSSFICDICKSASIITAASLTAKVQACRGDFVAQLSKNAEKLMGIVELSQLGTLRKKGTMKEEMNQESKIAESHLIWVLEILKHIFYSAGEYYIEDIIRNGKHPTKKSEPSVFIVLLAKLLKQCTPAQVTLKRQIIQVLINLASQSQKAKNEFCLLIRAQKLSFLQILIHQTLQTSPYTSRNVLLAYLELLKTLAMSIECVHAMVRCKFVPDMLSQLDPQIRQKKDIKDLSFLLQHVFGFLTTFAWGEEGRKALLANKSLLQLALMVLESENGKPRLLFNTLSFLRNICFQRTTKSEFLLNKKFIPSLIGFITSDSLSLKVKEAAATTFWNLVYNHQGVKAALSKSDVKQQLYTAMTEYDKEIDKAKYLPEEVIGDDKTGTKLAKTLEQLQNTRRAIELTITLLS